MFQDESKTGGAENMKFSQLHSSGHTLLWSRQKGLSVLVGLVGLVHQHGITFILEVLGKP